MDGAKIAQEEYCAENEVPMYAPYSGSCPRCYKDIYHDYKRNDGSVSRGYSISEARRIHITDCPHCNASFIE